MAEHHDILWAIMKDSDVSAAAKCVATVLLLKYRNHNTRVCNPSFLTIALQVGRKRRSVIDAVNELKAAGWVTWSGTLGGSSENTNNFDFHLKARGVQSTAPVQSSASLPVQSTAPTGAVERTRPVQRTAHDLSIEPSINSCADAPRSEVSALPAWAKPAGNGKYFVRIESEGGDLIARHCATTDQKLPMVSTREGAFIVPYVWPPGLEPNPNRQEAAA